MYCLHWKPVYFIPWTLKTWRRSLPIGKSTAFGQQLSAAQKPRTGSGSYAGSSCWKPTAKLSNHAAERVFLGRTGRILMHLGLKATDDDSLSAPRTASDPWWQIQRKQDCTFGKNMHLWGSSDKFVVIHSTSLNSADSNLHKFYHSWALHQPLRQRMRMCS